MMRHEAQNKREQNVTMPSSDIYLTIPFKYLWCLRLRLVSGPPGPPFFLSSVRSVSLFCEHNKLKKLKISINLRVLVPHPSHPQSPSPIMVTSCSLLFCASARLMFVLSVAIPFFLSRDSFSSAQFPSTPLSCSSATTPLLFLPVASRSVLSAHRWPKNTLRSTRRDDKC